MKRYLPIFLTLLAFCLANLLGNAFLSQGMIRTYGLSQNSDLLILGHSHIMLALNKDILEKELDIKVSKYTREGVNVEERFLMAQQYLNRPHSGKLKCVIIGVDPYLFTRGGLSQNSYINFYPFIEDKGIDTYVRDNSSSQEYWKIKLLPLCRYSDTALNSAISGWLRQSGASHKYGIVDIGRVKKEISAGQYRHIFRDAKMEVIFQKTIEAFTQRGIKVILLNTPLIDLYNALEPDAHKDVMSFYEQCARSNNLIEYWDYSRFIEDDYTLFRDPIHLNRNGQTKVSQAIAQRLEKEHIF